ncbi:MAG: glycosyltransferase family 4 protein [Bacteroides sp.]|nr:glycosyltransferase family 4 protein [Bacteroides sp.]
MIIGYDGKRAVNNMTGLGNYSRFIVEGIAEENPGDTLLLYTPKEGSGPRLDKIRKLPNVEFRYPAPQGLKGSLWRTFGITNHLRADKVDIFHGLSNELPLNIRSGGVPSVVTMHDVIYRRLPGCYKPIDRWMYDFKYGRSCRNADHIIAVSQRTKDDVAELYDIEPEKVTVVYQGCDPQFRRQWSAEELRELRSRLRLPQRYLLQVGTIEKRKNLEISVRALNNISPDMSLVVVGKDHHGYKSYIERLAAESGVTDRILFLEGLPFKDLPGINQGAEIVLYPSRYEGFGIPVLEALESGRPVIAATGSCLEEAGGPDTLYINPDDPSDMVQAVHALLSDPAATRMMTQAGKEYALRFRGEDMAAKVKNVYEYTIENFKRNKLHK